MYYTMIDYTEKHHSIIIIIGHTLGIVWKGKGNLSTNIILLHILLTNIILLRILL